ncbi:hypothetical protein [Shewanella algae]|uniref:hypothetical protein n=1 Tax=Shewanella algae TaxID=38313 RepID=UPI001AAF7D39|nr:hypothetical protein [Shewanella algae]MBO2591754.1 hypothetical protein [Shewanella algae]
MNKKKEKKRLAPKPSTLRQIHVLSGNQCAKPGCDTVLVNSNGTFVASVCHIYAAEDDGPRPNNNLSPEQKRLPENLILLCKLCHEIVDSEEDTYTAETLKKWKKDREAVFSEIGDTLKQSYLDQITDERNIYTCRPINNVEKYTDYLDQNNCSHSIDESDLKRLNEYINNLRNLTLNDRSLLVKIIETALSIESVHYGEHGLDVHPDDLKVLRVDGKPLSLYRIKQFAETLERHGLGYLDFECAPELRLNYPFDCLGWSELYDFGRENNKELSKYICDLDFTDLEGS